MKETPESVPRHRQRLRRIEGRHNVLVKQLRQAFAWAEPTEQGFCAIEGVRILEEAIRSGLRFQAIFFRESAESLAERLLPQIGAQVETLLLPDKLFNSSVASEGPQGVAALVQLKRFSLQDIMERLQVGPIIVIVALQDPGNLGTILRSAEAFGSAGIVLGEGTVSPFNSKVVRASAGSIFRLPLVIAKAPGEMKSALQLMRAGKIRLLATSSHKGTPLDQTMLLGPAAIFIGSEGSGLPRDVLAQVDELVAIPHTPQVESLNAGVAGSILLYEAARQRREQAAQV
ncbi:MAG TPA: RNA methyltransferase [Candidatus Sulfotelmatobacter sp.]|nr:RNA methyltransferase [Candidatus Sulfotelmatobacter sp.]